MITGMHIDDLIVSYNPVYPENATWEDTFNTLREDPHEFSIVQQLVQELEKYGQFRDPIILSNYEQWLRSEEKYEYDEGEEPDVYVPTVNDGTHRVFAHYLSPHKDAKVQDGYRYGANMSFTLDEDAEEDWYPLLVTLVILPEAVKLNDQMWEFFERYRSFKVTEEVWVTSDLMSSNGNALQLYWDTGVNDEEKLATLIAPLDAHLVKTAKGMGFSVIPLTGVVHSEEEDDAFFGRKPLER